MAGGSLDVKRIPWWCWAAPVAGAATVAMSGMVATAHPAFIAVAIVLLGGAVFAAVHHAEVLAIKIGEPFGSIMLALAITVLEVGLIISVIMSGSSGSDVVARDTIYAVVMIVLNGIVGLCLVSGAARHHEQEFHVQGAVATLSVIATLAIVALVLPNFTLTTPGPSYTTNQLMFVGAVSLLLYLLFVFVQSFRHRDHFVIDYGVAHDGEKPNARITAASAALMVLSLAVVILLAKTLAPTLEKTVVGSGLPLAVVGIVIAMIVLLPEGITALKAARHNRLQTSLNASLGSALASIGLTIPIVGTVSVLLGQTLTLGLGPEEMVLLLLTLFVSTLTFATGRTTVLQGAVHLVIFGIFLFLTAVP